MKKLYAKLEQLKREDVSELQKKIKSLGSYLRQEKKREIAPPGESHQDNRHNDISEGHKKKKVMKENKKKDELEMELKDLTTQALEDLDDAIKIKKQSNRLPVLSTCHDENTMHSTHSEKSRVSITENESTHNEKRKYHLLLEEPPIDNESTNKPTTPPSSQFERIQEEIALPSLEIKDNSTNISLDIYDGKEEYVIKKKKKTDDPHQEDDNLTKKPPNIINSNIKNDLNFSYIRTQPMANSSFSFLTNLKPN